MIKWTITDRENGDKLTVNHPGRRGTDAEFHNLSSTIKHCSAVQLVEQKRGRLRK